jgi:NOL1/NOP2/fmu family ribosome biogenesis protein
MPEQMIDEEVAALVEKINLQYGAKLAVEGHLLAKNEKRGARKIFRFTGSRIPKVPAEWVGSHFCTVDAEGAVIPSIEGAQLIGRTAEKIISVSYEDAEDIMAGKDIEADKGLSEGYYLLKTGDDVLGVGKIEGELILSFVPKSRRTSRQYKRE